MSAIADLMRAMQAGVRQHNEANPDHGVLGIGMAGFDMDRLGLEEGEDILPGIPLSADGGPSGMFRVLCDGQHDGHEAQQEAQEPVRVVSDPNPSRMDPVYASGHVLRGYAGKGKQAFMDERMRRWAEGHAH